MDSIAAGVETLRTTSSSGAQDLLGFGGAVINGLEGVSGDEQGEISLEATWILHEWTTGRANSIKFHCYAQ